MPIITYRGIRLAAVLRLADKSSLAQAILGLLFVL